MGLETTPDSGSEIPSEHPEHHTPITRATNRGFEMPITSADATIISPTTEKATDATWQPTQHGEAIYTTSETGGSAPGNAGSPDDVRAHYKESGHQQSYEVASGASETGRLSESIEAVRDAPVEARRGRRLRDRLYHLIATREPATRPNTQDHPEQRNLPPEYDRPDSGRLATEIQRTGGGRFEVSVLEENGPVVLVGTDGMLPKTGEKQDMEVGASQPPTKQVFTKYARLLRVETPPHKERQAVNNDTEGVRDGLRIEEIDHEIPGTVIIRPEPLTPDETNEVIATIEMYGHIAGQGGDTGAEATLRNKQMQLEATDTPVRVHTLVGAMNAEDLHDLAYDTAARVFPSDPTVRYKPATGPDGNVIVYDNEEDALAANRQMATARIDIRRNISTDGIGQYSTPSELANLVRLPEGGREVNGLRHNRMSVFAVNGPKLKEGALPLEFADIIDAEGKPQGKLILDARERAGHELTIAGSRWGKTTLINAKIRAGMQLKHIMRRERPEVRIPNEVLVDMEKVGTETMLGKELAGMRVNGEPLDPDLQAVTVIRPPRHDERNRIRPNLDILAPMEGSALDQIDIATRALSIGINDPEASRVFVKFVTMALTKTYEEMGHDMENGGSKYPGRTPMTPTPARVMAKLDEVISSSEFDAQTQGNLGGFTKTTLASMLRGRAGQLLQNGYNIDWDAARELEGTVNYQLGDVRNSVSKGAAMTVIMEGCEAANRRASPPGDLKPQTTLHIDEPGRTFDGKTEAGADNANKFTIAAGKGGLTMAVYKQGKTEEIDQHVRDNTAGVYIGRTSGDDDEQLAKRLGIPPAELANLKATGKGRGLHLGPDMENGPVLFQLENPEKLPTGEAHIIDAAEAGILDLGTDNDFYTVGEWADAQKFLKEESDGTLVKGWADMSVIQVLTGRPVLGLDGELKQTLNKMSAGERSRTLDKAICDAVRISVEGRPYVMNEMEPLELAAYVRDQLLDQARPDAPRPELPPHELRLNMGQLAELRDQVTHNLTPRPLRRPEYLEFGVEIEGNNAIQQRDVLRRWVNELITDTTQHLQTIVANSDEGGDPAARQAAVEKAKYRVVQLTAGLKETPEEFLTASLLTKMNKKIEQLNEKELDAIKAVTNNLSPKAWTPMGYAAVFEKLDKHIERHRTNLRPLDLSAFKDALGTDFAAATAEEQQKLVLQKEAEFIKATGYSINTSDLLFVKDEGGGYILDQVLSELGGREGPRGLIHDEQRAQQGNAKIPTLLEAFGKAEDADGIEKVATEWTAKASRQLIYGHHFGHSQFKFSPSGQAFMVEQLAASVHFLKLDALNNLGKKNATKTTK